MRDMVHNILLKRAVSPVSDGDNTALVSQIIDRAGFQSLTFLMGLGSIADADATFTVLLEESDDSGMSGANAVADADMISQTPGTLPELAAGFQFDDDNEVRVLGYVGNKRYTRLTVTPANNASAALFSALALLGHPDSRPVTQSAS
jgi:hypothetical protein